MKKIIKNVTDDDLISRTFFIPDGVVEIGDWAFRYCSSLENIVIPASVKKIGGWAFRQCTNLKSITLPDSVKKIGTGAFSCCENLKNISLPKKVKLGKDVFLGCHPDLKIEYRD